VSSVVVSTEPVEARERATPLAVGVIVWLTSELMFFGGLFAAWFTLRANDYPNWPPPGEHIEPGRMLFGTALLVTSSFTIHRSLQHTSRDQRRPAIGWLAVTFCLGAVFLINEVLEWRSLDFTFSDSAFSTIFYLITGMHGAHVFMGLVLMVLVGWVAFGQGTRVKASPTMHAVGYYWHFVDVVWIILFIVVYVLTWLGGAT
jgi:cytochrome c oxidase subunit III